MECLLIRQYKFTQTFNYNFLSVGRNVISFSTTAKNLGFYFRHDKILDAHVQDICPKAYIDIQRISSIRHLLSIDATTKLLSAVVLPKLYYCNYLFYGSPTYILERFQKDQNSAAGLIIQCHKQNHISPISAH